MVKNNITKKQTNQKRFSTWPVSLFIVLTGIVLWGIIPHPFCLENSRMLLFIGVPNQLGVDPFIAILLVTLPPLFFLLLDHLVERGLKLSQKTTIAVWLLVTLYSLLLLLLIGLVLYIAHHTT